MSALSKIPNDLKSKWDAAAVKYEKKRAAMLPILRLAQEHFGYITPDVEFAVAEYLETTPVHVREVVTFYELFRTKLEGKNQIRFCQTLSCVLGGSEELLEYIKTKLGIESGETTKDGKFTLHTAECLGACEMAPMMQVNKDFHGPLTKEKIDEIFENM
ncbi:MAG: NAD(P)H-dependent oxidoreductase subunit E [Candidatus Omnitrophica bacterium]|nr:NAD(P)H-dependent oxidoreductase subunit E [Candidatus Omnitrophota bacterium]